jgi:hypothetical protein
MKPLEGHNNAGSTDPRAAEELEFLCSIEVIRQQREKETLLQEEIAPLVEFQMRNINAG